jgi:hypothetical protein
MAPFEVVVKNVTPTEFRRVYQFESTTKDDKTKIYFELPERIILFKEKDTLEIELSTTKKKTVKPKKNTLEISGKIYDVSKEDGNQIISLSFWGLKAKIISATTIRGMSQGKDVFLTISKSK